MVTGGAAVVVVVGADVAVVVGGVAGAFDGVVVAVVGGGAELAVAVVDGAEELPDDEFASVPSESFAGVELKLSTPASPATVPIITSGARFILTRFRCRSFALTHRSSKGEDLLVNPLVSRAKAKNGFSNGLVKGRWSTHVDVSIVDVA